MNVRYVRHEKDIEYYDLKDNDFSLLLSFCGCLHSVNFSNRILCPAQETLQAINIHSRKLERWVTCAEVDSARYLALWCTFAICSLSLLQRLFRKLQQNTNNYTGSSGNDIESPCTIVQLFQTEQFSYLCYVVIVVYF